MASPLSYVPPDIWAKVMDSPASSSRDAASLACVCRDTAAAYRRSRAFRRARVSRDGQVLEPASGTFDVEVAPGESVFGAIHRCPLGGSVRLLPGSHRALTGGGQAHDDEDEDEDEDEDDLLLLFPGDDVFVFGRELADCRFCVVSTAWTSAFIGVNLLNTVEIRGGCLRLQQCRIARRLVCCEGATPSVARCNLAGSTHVMHPETGGTFADNAITGIIFVSDGASPVFKNNSIASENQRAVHVYRATATFLDNRIRVAPTDQFTTIGIQVMNCPACVIENNSIHHATVGILLQGSVARIVGNDMWNHTNINVDMGSTADVRHNFLRGTKQPESCGISCEARSLGIFADNVFWNHDFNVFVDKRSAPVVRDNVFSDSRVGVRDYSFRVCVERNALHNVRRAHWPPTPLRLGSAFGAFCVGLGALKYVKTVCDLRVVADVWVGCVLTAATLCVVQS